MPRLRVIGRGSLLCDVILLASLMSLGAVFLTLYADVARRNSPRDFPVVAMTSSDEDVPAGGKSPPSHGAGPETDLTRQTVEELLRRVPDVRPPLCRRRRYQQLPAATIVVVFSDYEFYDARLTLTSVLRDAELAQLVTEILLVDDASRRDQVLADARNYIRSASTSLPVVRLVRLGSAPVGRVRARSLAAERHVTSDVAVFVDAGVVCAPGWLSPLLELVSGAAGGQSTIAVPHYDQLVHPVTLQYLQTDSEIVAALSWSLTIRMRRQDASTDSLDDVDRLSRSVSVLRGDVFAVRRTFLSSIGGLYDFTLERGSGVAEHVELSLRTWLCGGNIKVGAACC